VKVRGVKGAGQNSVRQVGSCIHALMQDADDVDHPGVCDAVEQEMRRAATIKTLSGRPERCLCRAAITCDGLMHSLADFRQTIETTDCAHIFQRKHLGRPSPYFACEIKTHQKMSAKMLSASMDLPGRREVYSRSMG
jgi:hypothetical protein